MTTNPKVSVLIPCDGRPCLAKTLDVLLASRPETPYEVIVVGALPKGMEELKEPVRFLPDEARLTGPMRNRAAEAARGDILLFTDSDCIPDREWLDRAADSCTAERPVVAGGIRFPEEDARDCGDNLAIFHMVHVSQCAGRAEGKIVGTNNLAVRRDVFLKLGGFNPGLCSGEDSEFLHRAVEAGHPVWFDPGFAVKHESGRTTAEKIRGHARWYAEGSSRLLLEGMVKGSGWRAERFLRWVPGGFSVWSAVKATLGVAGIVAKNLRLLRLWRAFPWAWYFLYERRAEMFRRMTKGDG